ncbi:MAG: sugar phosphate isomerase/epimerase [Kiritimatiellae bacterium]|nr:sugar phosphate isomerase/epimerase [Kiritimatiellia bacterium]
MRVCVSTAWFGEADPRKAIQTFVDEGWTCGDFSHVEWLLRQDKPVAAAGELKKFADDLGFDFPQAHFDLANTDPGFPPGPGHAEHFDRIRLWCELFMALGVKAGILHKRPWPTPPPDGRPSEEIHEAMLKGFETIAGYVKGGPTVVCLENGPSGTKGVLPVVEAVKGMDMGICLDTGHQNRGEEKCADFVRAVGSRLKALHIHDNAKAYDDHFFPYGPGGTTDWSGFVDALAEIGYDGVWAYESFTEITDKPYEIRLVKLRYAKELAKVMLGDAFEG